MSYSFVKYKLSKGHPAIQIGGENIANINRVHNKTEQLHVQSLRANSTNWVLLVITIIIIIIAVLIIKQKRRTTQQ